MIAVTGASGKLGRLVIETLLETVPASSIVAAVRNPDAVSDLAARGVAVRHADYDAPDTLASAFAGVEKLLLISSSEIGKRAPQHQAVIDAARTAGVTLLAYTSILRADSSPMALAEEHKATEAALKASGLDHVLLRNGWYTENYESAVAMAVEHGAVMGAARDGRIAAASRRDYAEAAAAVLLSPENQAGKVYELAGDSAFTLREFANEIARQSGKSVVYSALNQADYQAALVKVGLPGPYAALLAESDAKAANGALFDDSGSLSALIGRPTSNINAVVTATLAA